MAELSRATGVPIPTIKYYLREGLVPGGERTSRNQAHYDETHVRRIRMVRALTDCGGLQIATIRRLLHRADDPNTSVNALLGAAQRAVTPVREPESGEAWERAAARVHDLLARRGWQDVARHPAVHSLIGILATLDELGYGELAEVLDAYAEGTEIMAAADLATVGDMTDRARAVEIVVIGTPIGDSMIAAMRRLAQAHTTIRLFGSGAPDGIGASNGTDCSVESDLAGPATAEPAEEPADGRTEPGHRAGDGVSGAGEATRRRPARRSVRR
jgi:DNA-binding transcriptional MerR regulator